jgi:DHA1 family bicyclomycin/chloramphenicol resistance-like MFS transporter
VTASAGEPSDGRPIRVHFALLATLTVILSLTPYSVDAFLPAFPGAREAFGASASTTQLTLSAFLIGIACGQLIFGPISDQFGRRMPLIIGAGACAVAATVAALAPTIEVLIAARLIQGAAGAAGMVISKAIIRDRTVGADTVAFLSKTTIGSGVLTVFAPVVGGLLTQTLGWRGPLWFIAAVATAMALLVVVTVPETHAFEHRDGRSRWFALASVARHLRNRSFLVFVIIQAGSYGTLMAYVAASPFVYQTVLGFDVALYGLLFAVNASCGVLCNFLANQLLRGIGSHRLIAISLGLSIVGAVMTTLTWTLGAPAWVIAACITLAMAPLGLNGPNIVGLALNQVTRSTGSAAATIGFAQFCAGAIVAPIVGLAGASLWPMTITMMVLAGGSLLVLLCAAPGRAGRATPL